MKWSSSGKARRVRCVIIRRVVYRDPRADPVVALDSMRTVGESSRELIDRNIA